MEHLDPMEFGRRTAEGRPCGHYDLSLFYGLEFKCACGECHQLRPWMEILSELPLFKIVLACPEGLHLTVVKARWEQDQNRCALEAELGTALTKRRDSRTGIEFQTGLLEARTGRKWSLEETEALMEFQQELARSRA